MRISDDALATRNKFIAQLDNLDDCELERRYRDALLWVRSLRDRMEKNVSDMLASLQNTDKDSLFDTWNYNVMKIVTNYEDWFVYKDLAISAKALIECKEREKESNNGRD